MRDISNLKAVKLTLCDGESVEGFVKDQDTWAMTIITLDGSSRRLSFGEEGDTGSQIQGIEYYTDEDAVMDIQMEFTSNESGREIDRISTDAAKALFNVLNYVPIDHEVLMEQFESGLKQKFAELLLATVE